MTTYTPAEFAAHLETTGRRLHPQMTRVINRAAMNIQADWRQRAVSHNPPGSFSGKYPGSIIKRRGMFTNTNTYEISVETSDRGQGRLGAILEYGGVNNSPQRSNVAAAKAEAPALHAWLAKIAAEAI